MTTNLDGDFREALLGRKGWNPNSVRKVVAAFRSVLPAASVDWEEGDENWARLMIDGEVVAIVNALVPIVVVLSKLRDKVQGLAENNKVALIVADSFSDHSFCVDKQLVEQVVARELSSNIDYRSLSIDDLWWTTIS